MVGKLLIALFTMQSSVLSTLRKGRTGSYGPQTQGRCRGSQGTSELWKDPTAQNGSDHQRMFSQVKCYCSTQGICKPWARREHRAAGLLQFLHGKAMQMQPVLAKMGSSSSSLQDAWATRECHQSVVLDTLWFKSKCMERMNCMTYFTHPNQESYKRQKCETRECKREFLGWPLLWWTEYVGNLRLWPKFWEWVNSLCRRAWGFFWGFWQVQLQVAKRSQKWIFLSTQRKSAVQRNWDCRNRTKLYSYIPLQHHQLQAQGHIFQKGSKISPPNLGSPTRSQKGI